MSAAQSLELSDEQQADPAASFVGSWSLQRFERTAADGSVTHPLGASPTGLISYSSDGAVSVHLCNDYCNYEPGMPQYTGYFGYFAVDEARNVVIHRVRSASAAELVGTTQERSFSFDGKRLILSTTTNDAHMKLVWTKESGAL